MDTKTYSFFFFTKIKETEFLIDEKNNLRKFTAYKIYLH